MERDAALAGHRMALCALGAASLALFAVAAVHTDTGRREAALCGPSVADAAGGTPSRCVQSSAGLFVGCYVLSAAPGGHGHRDWHSYSTVSLRDASLD